MTVEAVLETLDEYARTYCAKDIDGLMAVFHEGEDISVIGTGADEFCVGANEIQGLFLRNFAEATAKRFEWLQRHTMVTGDQAVVAVSLTIHLDVAGDLFHVPVRWTVVLRHLDADGLGSTDTHLPLQQARMKGAHTRSSRNDGDREPSRPCRGFA